jgi:hypothetical protein
MKYSQLRQHLTHARVARACYSHGKQSRTHSMAVRTFAPNLRTGVLWVRDYMATRSLFFNFLFKRAKIN